MGGEVLKTSPPTFRSAIKTTQINSKSLKVETTCALSVSGVVSVVQAAMQRVSGDVEVSRVLPESAVITPPQQHCVGTPQSSYNGIETISWDFTTKASNTEIPTYKHHPSTH